MYKFTKEQQNILKRVYGRKTFTKEFYKRILETNIVILNKKLNTVGYRLKIELKER